MICLLFVLGLDPVPEPSPLFFFCLPFSETWLQVAVLLLLFTLFLCRWDDDSDNFCPFFLLLVLLGRSTHSFHHPSESVSVLVYLFIIVGVCAAAVAGTGR